MTIAIEAEMTILWNEHHKTVLRSENPMSIIKIGSTEANYVANYLKGIPDPNNDRYRYELDFGCGVKSKDHTDHIRWCDAYIRAIQHSDYLHLWQEFCYKNSTEESILVRLQKDWTDSFVYNRLAETFDMKLKHTPVSMEHDWFFPFKLKKAAWHHQLASKKVLVVSSAQRTFEQQAEIYDKLWGGSKLGGFEFVKVPDSSVLSNDPNSPYWIEKVDQVTNEIAKRDFDFAMIGCGGIGLLVNDFIKTELNKSCTYLGGGIQLFFGIRGGRWENQNNRDWYNTNEYWTAPLPEDCPPNYKSLEGGCYWI